VFSLIQNHNQNFHNHVDFLFSECIKLLGLIRFITFTVSSPDCLYVLYFKLLRSKCLYDSVVWHSIMPTGANTLHRIQQKFASVCFHLFFPSCSFQLYFALQNLRVYSLRKRRHCFDLSTLALNPALPFWKILLFVFLLAMLGTSQRLMLVPLINKIFLAVKSGRRVRLPTSPPSVS
jgi:hypothetical protein